jgi:hypothetical protein
MKVRLLVIFLLLNVCLAGCSKNSETNQYSQAKNQPASIDSINSTPKPSESTSTLKPSEPTSALINNTAKSTQASGRIDISSASPVTINTSTFKSKENASLQTITTTPRFEPITESSNAIIDENVWFKNNNLVYPFYKVDDKFLSNIATEPVPNFIPKSYKGIPLSEASFDSKNIYLYFYDSETYKDSYLCVINKSEHKVKYIYNFTNFHFLNDSLHQEVARFAIEENGILYVSNYHMTYSKDTNYKNAYLTAIDTKSNKVLWRTDSLVSNSRNFLIKGNYIISGYGFTSEDDYLFIINKGSGNPLSKLKVKSSPDFIIEKGSKIYVRCYDIDYVFGFLE